ncbi:hypothetical protein ACGFRB_04340 [Streptomyces sp. NPDC048718]|uniref:hypothetical protein n=1 Tax=Streptomyces sp. NPDC048718 TaxID=3365587 RepID=UPI003722BE98
METATLLDESLEAASGEVDDLTRWHALAQLVRVYEALGDLRLEYEALAGLTAPSGKLGCPTLQGRARLRLARCARDLAGVKAARDAVAEALAAGDERHPRISAADAVRARLLLVSWQAELGDLAEAARLAAEVWRAVAQNAM